MTTLDTFAAIASEVTVATEAADFLPARTTSHESFLDPLLTLAYVSV